MICSASSPDDQLQVSLPPPGGRGGAVIFTMYGSSSLALRVCGFLKQFGWIYDGDDDTTTLVRCDFFIELYSCKCHQNSDDQKTM